MKRRTLLALLLSAQACTPTLTPVFPRQATPLTVQANPPRIIWALDTSGSLNFPIDVDDPACTQQGLLCGSGGAPCPAACATRQDALVAGLRTFETQLPTELRHDAVFFPQDNLCGPPRGFEYRLSFPQLTARTEAVGPSGGTPTAAALQFVADLEPVAQQETLVVLITDGIPNCNAANPHNLCDLDPGATDAGERLQACRCTTNFCMASLCSLGCTDELGPVAASHQLAQREMQLMVIAQGPEIELARPSLSTMEMALGPACTSSAQCDGLPCGPDGMCTDKLFRAPTAAEFGAPAEALGLAVRRSMRCVWWLPRQVTAADLRIEVGGAEVPAADWSLRAPGASNGGEWIPADAGYFAQRVVFSGATCAALLTSDEVPSISWLPPAQ